MHIHLLLCTLRGLRGRLEQRQSFREVTDGFDMGGVFGSLLTRLGPVGDRLSRQSCFRPVMGDKFWLGLSNLWELGFGSCTTSVRLNTRGLLGGHQKAKKV